MKIEEALTELKKLKKRKFDQSVDLIINLKGIDLRRDNVSTILSLPHKVKDKKVCGFLTKKSELVNTITKPEFAKYKDKKELKKLVKNYDFFIGAASLMPAVATAFGKALGPAGKMPSPQLGIVAPENDEVIKNVLKKIEKSEKIRMKETSIKLSAGKESMGDEKILENLRAIYDGIVDILPTKKENVKSVMIKLTMSKPIKVEMK